MPNFKLIAEIKPAGTLVFALLLDGVATGINARLNGFLAPDGPGPRLVETQANFAGVHPTTVNLLPGADSSASQALATANSWAYNAALTPAEQVAIEAARALP